MPSIVDATDVAVGRANVLGTVDRADVNACDMPDSDRLGRDGSPSAWKALTAVAIPCWVPLTRSGPRAVVAPSGGKNPNGVFTLAGPVE